MKLLFDFFPILLFFLAYKLYGIYVATGVAMGASLLQVGAYWHRHRRFEKMHLVTLALIMVLGGATLLFEDKAFIMWKPTAVNWAFALAFFGSHFIGDRTLVERMMGHAIDVPKVVWKRLNFSWVIFFVLMGLANLYMAGFYFEAEQALFAAAGGPIDVDTCLTTQQGELLALCRQAHVAEESWVNFKLFGMLGLTIVFIIGQAVYLARHARPVEAAKPAAELEGEKEH